MAWSRRRRRSTSRSSSTAGRRCSSSSGIYAQAQTQIDVSFFLPLNQLTDSLDSVFRLSGTRSARPGPLLVVVRRPPAAPAVRTWRCAPALAAAVAWGVAVLLQELARTRTSVPRRRRPPRRRPGVPGGQRRDRHRAAVRDRPPYLVRPLRRIFDPRRRVRSCAATMYLGVGLPSDVLGGAPARLLGRRAGRDGARHHQWQAVGRRGARRARRPRATTSRRIARASRTSVGDASVIDVELDVGRAPSASTRSGATSARRRSRRSLWHRAMYKEPGTTGVRQPDPAGRARRATRCCSPTGPTCACPSSCVTGVGGPDAAVLVTRPPAGHPARRPRARPDHRRVLRDAWSTARRAPRGRRHARQPRPEPASW